MGSKPIWGQKCRIAGIRGHAEPSEHFDAVANPGGADPALPPLARRGGEPGAPAAADRLCRRLCALLPDGDYRSEEHKSELQSLMRISYAVCCLKKNKKN